MLAPAPIPAPPPALVRTVVIGHSAGGRAIRATELRASGAHRVVLVVGCIHGNESAGLGVVAALRRRAVPGVDLWLLPVLNPDGLAARTRGNAHGVDLNRNFPAGWRALGRRGDPEWSGPRPLSEPETRAARALILRVRPALTIWFDQPQAVVRAWGPSRAAARRFAALAQIPFRALPWPPGAATRWQNRIFPRAAAFVVELPPGPLSHPRALGLAAAVRSAAARPANG